jgi:hypothetical protein
MRFVSCRAALLMRSSVMKSPSSNWPLLGWLALVLLATGIVVGSAEFEIGPTEEEQLETDSINPAPFQADADATPISLSALLPPVSQMDWSITTLSSSDGRVCVLHTESLTLRSLTSLDGGTTFAPEVDVAGMGAEPEIKDYRAVIGPDDRIHVALLVADPAGGLGLRYVRSDDVGATWTSQTTLVTAGASSFALYSKGLAISANGSGVVAIAYTSDETGGAHLAYTLDGGNSWPETAYRVDLAQGIPFTFYGDVSVLADRRGNIHVAYSQGRGSGSRLYVRRRSFTGVWSAEGPTGTDLPLDGSESATLAEAADGGILLAYWRLDGNAIVVLRSVDNGVQYLVSLDAVALTDNETPNPRLTTDPTTATVLLSYERRGQLRVRRSSDFGATFHVETTLAYPSPDRPHSVARSSGGTWAFAWEVSTAGGNHHDIFLRSSDDDGLTFGPPHRVDSGSAGLELRAYPQVVATGGEFLVVYLDERGNTPPTPDTSYNIFANRTVVSPISFDESDYRIDTDDGVVPPISDRFDQTVATDGADHVYVAFDARSPGNLLTVFVAASSDRGKTFGAPVAIGASATGNTYSYLPRLAATPDGHVYLAYQSHFDPQGDVLVRFNSSSDFGQTWQSSDQVLGSVPQSAVIWDGQPIPGPNLAALPGGKVWIAWSSGDEIFLSRSIDGGLTVTTDDVDQNDTPDERSPRLCAQGDQVILAWRGLRQAAGNPTVWAAISDDGGVSFGPREELSPDPGHAEYLRMACDGTGKAVVVWNDRRDGQRRLWSSRYDGSSWSPDTAIPGPTSPTIRFHWDPRLAFTDGNLGEPTTLALTYNSCLADDNPNYCEIYFNSSTDGGATFSPFVRLDLACPEPENGSWYPRVATDGYDNVWVSWRDHSANRGYSSIVVRRSTDGGASFGPVVRLDRKTQGSFYNGYWMNAETAALPQIGLFAWLGQNNTTFKEILFLADDRSDDDTDGVNGSLDCDDTDPDIYPGAPQLCDGVNNDCDDTSWPDLPAAEADGDSDGSRVCGGDCDDADPDTYPGAAEVNDGNDNQCSGDAGYGVADETSGDSGFHNPADRNEYSWTAQQGATLYAVARSGVSDFSADCLTFTTSDTLWVDEEQPLQGSVFHYLNRPVAPHIGSWGMRSGDVERTAICP